MRRPTNSANARLTEIDKNLQKSFIFSSLHTHTLRHKVRQPIIIPRRVNQISSCCSLAFTQHHGSCIPFEIHGTDIEPSVSLVLNLVSSKSRLMVRQLQMDGTRGYMALNTLMRLSSGGHIVDFKGLHNDINPSARHTDLPLYPFRLEPHSYPVRKAAKVGTPSIPSEVELFPRVPSPSTELKPLLENHVMAGHALCPSSDVERPSPFHPLLLLLVLEPRIALSTE
jgi:hypothetical protein